MRSTFTTEKFKRAIDMEGDHSAHAPDEYLIRLDTETDVSGSSTVILIDDELPQAPFRMRMLNLQVEKQHAMGREVLDVEGVHRASPTDSASVIVDETPRESNIDWTSSNAPVIDASASAGDTAIDAEATTGHAVVADVNMEMSANIAEHNDEFTTYYNAGENNGDAAGVDVIAEFFANQRVQMAK